MHLGRRRAVAGVVSAIFVVIIIAGATQVRFDPDSIDRNWNGTPIPPCFLDAMKCYGHALGTDEIGRDMLARLMYGAIVSLGVPLIALAFEVMLGIGMAISARRGGPVVTFVAERFEAALSCFPPWAFMLAMIAVRIPHRFEPVWILVLAGLAGLVFSPRIARVVRSISEVRNSLPTLLDRGAYDLTRLVVLLATIDFFWLGGQPPTPSWGNMIYNGYEAFPIAWWVAGLPAISLFGAVIVIETLRRLLFDGVARAGNEGRLSLM